MSTTVTLNGVTYTYETDFIGSDGYAWTKPKSPASTGNVLFSLLNDFLADVVLEKAGIASVSGVSPSSAGNVLISDGSNWVRSHSSGVTALLDALTVSGTSSLQAVTATSVSAVIGAGNDATLTLNQAGVTAWTVTNRATSGLLAISQGGNDWFTIAKTTGVASLASSLTVAAGLTVTAGGITVSAGTSAFQAVTASGAIITTASVVGITPATPTAAGYFRVTNSQGNYYFGVEDSVGGTFGTTAYNMVLYTPAGLALSISKTSNNATFGASVTITSGFGCNGKSAQTAAVSGGTLAGVIAALVANGVLSS